MSETDETTVSNEENATLNEFTKGRSKPSAKKPQVEAKLTLDEKAIQEMIEKAKKEAKDEAKAELMAEMAQSLGISKEVEPTAEVIAQTIAKKQKKSFNEANPVQEGFTYCLSKGKKLLMVFRRADGTSRTQFMGDIHRHEDAKALYEKIKNDPKMITYK